VFFPLSDHGVVLNFRDPECSPGKVGWHPVEVMLSSEGRIQYVTDFAFSGPDHVLVKGLDFDFVVNPF